MQSSDVWATSRQPLLMVSEWPRLDGSETTVIATPVSPQRLQGQLGHQTHDHVPDPLVEPPSPERGRRGQGDPVAHPGLGHDRPQPTAPRRAGQADHQVPPRPLTTRHTASGTT